MMMTVGKNDGKRQSKDNQDDAGGDYPASKG